MNRYLPIVALAIAAPALAADPAPSPGEIVAAAPKGEWVAIAPSDLLVMDLAASAKGKPRRVVIQLMPPPFSQGWIGNIRKLAAAHWWDGLAVVRVQDNYVAQWGDPDGEDKAKAKRLPSGLATVSERNYSVSIDRPGHAAETQSRVTVQAIEFDDPGKAGRKPSSPPGYGTSKDPYASAAGFEAGWPIGVGHEGIWPVHCYGMVGVGRNLSPDTGSGAELYAVIGHAPRHLDRNIALVGRVIEGVEHLSSLPRGTGALGFYETPEERTTIVSIRLGNEVAGLPAYEFLSTEGPTFARYADARANRRDPFFITPAGGADICNIPVPVRRAK